MWRTKTGPHCIGSEDSCQTGAPAATIAGVQSPVRPTPHPRASLFLSEARVILPLRNPRKKRRAEGLDLSNVELSSFDDHVAMATEGKPLDPREAFLRTHGIELTQPDPWGARRASLADHFAARVSVDSFALLDLAGAAQLTLRVRW